MPYISPDLLFQTRSGVTPHVLWGVPWSETFFGAAFLEQKETLRKTIYALFQLAALENSADPSSWRDGFSQTLAPFLEADRLREVLKFSMCPEMRLPGAFPILAAARSLGTLASCGIFRFSETDRLFEELEQLTQDASALSVEEEPLSALLLAGELALTLACQLHFGKVFPRVSESACSDASVCDPGTVKAEVVKGRGSSKNADAKRFQREKKLRRQAKKVLSESLDLLLDGAGMPRADLLPCFRILAASWVRSRWLDLALQEDEKKDGIGSAGKGMPETVFDEDALSSFEWMIRQLIYLTRPDGSLIFSQSEEKNAFWCPELFVAALRLDSDRADKKLAVAVLPDLKIKDADRHENELPEPSLISPWGKTAVLQKNWRTRTSAVVSWGETIPRLEVLNRKLPMLSGDWGFRGLWNGRELRPVGEWTQLFWHSTERADYLELELELSANFTLQRQILLAKEENFMLFGDALSRDGFRGESVSRGKLQWTVQLPLMPGVRVEENVPALEHFVFFPKGGAGTFLPLSLPEWREELHGDGGPEVRENAFCLTCGSDHGALYAPIFLDLDAKRIPLARTWRRLCVGEKLQNVPPYRAAGFRVQTGESQWLIFRSLAESCNRSVLGRNLNSETFIGKFLEDGNCETILEVERSH